MTNASEPEGWTAPISVPPAKPRRRRSSLWGEVAFLIAVIVVPAALLETYSARHYLCIFCHAVRTDNEWRGVRWTTSRGPNDDTRLYDALAGPDHVHRWTRGRTGSERYLLTGTVWAVMDRDASPLLHLYGDYYARLLRARHSRDGDLSKLEAEFQAIQDAYDRGDEAAVDRLYAPLRAEAFGSPWSRSPQRIGPSGPVEKPAPPRKPLPEAI